MRPPNSRKGAPARKAPPESQQQQRTPAFANEAGRHAIRPSRELQWLLRQYCRLGTVEHIGRAIRITSPTGAIIDIAPAPRPAPLLTPAERERKALRRRLRRRP
jgi:hypothetical protein